ncbi:MAG: 5-formyltetrahydrofolate cyclo-ligase [Eubacteriales bacterium]|nr:5-formyltetrahydrofolate cyclo-ligase [Eubacteriales bacterium]
MKKDLRKEIIERRDLLTPDEIKEKSSLIRNQLFNMKEYIECDSIFCFLSFGSEVITDEIIKDALMTKKVFVPFVDRDEDLMYPIEIKNMDDFRVNKFGIREPKSKGRFHLTRLVSRPVLLDRASQKETSPLTLVPGVAFDRKGYRIGYGKGYYDRFFHTFPVKSKIALAFGLQIIESVPFEEHDVPVDMILTENELIRIT